MTGLDAGQVARLSRRFGPPAVWQPTVHLTEHDQGVLRLGGAGRRHDVTFAVLDSNSQVAVIRPTRFPPGAWRIPSGGIRAGEAIEDGIQREALEELGIAIELTGYPLVTRTQFVRQDGGKLRWTSHVVTARPRADTNLAPRDRTEVAEATWMGFEQLTGPVASVLREGPGGLRRYRADLHDRLARLLAVPEARRLEE